MAGQAKRAKRAKPKHHASVYRAKVVPIRLAKHAHTGKRLPFYCTSYAALFFLLVFASGMIIFADRIASANPESSSIGLSGEVKGKPPEIGAKIAVPLTGTRLTESQVEVRGSCLQDTFVEIYRNNVFAGMTRCDSTGNFSIIVSLLAGKNDLVARTRDGLNQYGPDSNKIVVYFDSANQSAASLLIMVDAYQDGISIDQKFKLAYRLEGGKQPYTVSFDWGDNTPAELVKQDSGGRHVQGHFFKQSGFLTVRISVIDNSGSTASVQTMVLVNGGQIAASGTTCGNGTLVSDKSFCVTPAKSDLVDKLWPVIIISTVLTASFWMGEQVVVRRLTHMPAH